MTKREYPKENVEEASGLGVEWKYIMDEDQRIPSPRRVELSKVVDNAFDLKPFPANCRKRDESRIKTMMLDTIANSTITPITVMKNFEDGLYYAIDGNHLQKVAKLQGKEKILAFIMKGNLAEPVAVWRAFLYSYRLNRDKMNAIEKVVAVHLARKHYGYKKYYREDIAKDFGESKADISAFNSAYKELKTLPELERNGVIEEFTKTTLGPQTVIARIQSVKGEIEISKSEDKIKAKNIETYEKIDRRVYNIVKRSSDFVEKLKQLDAENEIARCMKDKEAILGMIIEQRNKYPPHDVSAIETILNVHKVESERVGKILSVLFGMDGKPGIPMAMSDLFNVAVKYKDDIKSRQQAEVANNSSKPEA